MHAHRPAQRPRYHKYLACLETRECVAGPGPGVLQRHEVSCRCWLGGFHIFSSPREKNICGQDWRDPPAVLHLPGRWEASQCDALC